MNAIVVLTTTSSLNAAKKIAAKAVEQNLAACVQIVGPIQSVYRWKGNVEVDEEFRCEMKTVASIFPKLEALIQEIHSYDTPEIISLPIQDISDSYADWMATCLEQPS